MQEDSSDSLKKLEEQARQMGVPEDEIQKRRGEILGRLKQEKQDALEEVRELDEKARQQEVDAFAQRTGEDMSRHPETGRPLDQVDEDA